MKPVVLLLWNDDDDDVERVMVFDSHVDARETAVSFGSVGHCWTMMNFEYYEAGQKPEDTPAAQIPMALDDD